MAGCKNPQNKGQYYLYLVTEVLSGDKPPIEIMKDPWGLVEQCELTISPSIFELSLKK